jgi:hypothetical protein
MPKADLACSIGITKIDISLEKQLVAVTGSASEVPILFDSMSMISLTHSGFPILQKELYEAIKKTGKAVTPRSAKGEGVQ